MGANRVSPHPLEKVSALAGLTKGLTDGTFTLREPTLEPTGRHTVAVTLCLSPLFHPFFAVDGFYAVGLALSEKFTPSALASSAMTPNMFRDLECVLDPNLSSAPISWDVRRYVTPSQSRWRH